MDAAALAQADGAGTPTPDPSPTPGPPSDPVEALLPGGAVSYPERVVLAVVILVAGYYLSKFLVRLLGRPVARRFERQSVAQTILRLFRLTATFLAVLAALIVLQVPIGNLVLSAAVFSAVLGIVLAPIVGDVINGVFVLADQPFEIGDMVELEDETQGFVDEMTIRYTKIFTLDNTFAVIPNSTIRKQQVVNYSAEDERTRLRLSLLVTYESDVPAARRLMERAARDVDVVIEGGPDIRVGTARYTASPTAYIDEYGDNGVLLTMRYWTTRPYKLLKLRSAINERIWSYLSETDDVEAAYPHQHLVFDETSGTARVAVEQLDPGGNGRAGDAPDDPHTGRGTGPGRTPDSNGVGPDEDGSEGEQPERGSAPGSGPGPDGGSTSGSAGDRS
jgi:small-conductance mechanosensitive channel